MRTKQPPRPRRALSEQLAAARDAVKQGELGAGLALLLAAWRARPAAAIAEAIDAIGDAAAKGVAPPSGVTAKLKNAAWNAAAEAGDPVMRGVLLATLTDTKGNADTLARLELLVPHGDPRVARAVAGLLETPIYNASVNRTRKFWKRLLELAVELGDERMLARSTTFAEAWRRNASLNEAERDQLTIWLRKLTPPLTEAFGEAQPLAPDEAALCVAVAGAVPGPSARSVASRRTADALLEAIYANPADDAARMVYADALSMRGDPRGELITLQLARARGEPQTREQARREKALIAEHLMDWLGPVGALIKKTTAKLERGFLAVAELKDGKSVDDSPAWATVHTLSGGVPPHGVAMPALRALRDVPSRDIVVLAERTTPLAIDELHWRGPELWRSPHHPDHDAAEAAAVAAFLRLRLRLRTLGLGFGAHEWEDAPAMSDVAWAWSAPACAALETLGLCVSPRAIPDALAALRATPIRRLAILEPPYRETGWSIACERTDGDFRHLAIAARAIASLDERVAALRDGLAALPADQLRTVSITAPADVAKTFAAMFRGQRAVQVTFP